MFYRCAARCEHLIAATIGREQQQPVRAAPSCAKWWHRPGTSKRGARSQERVNEVSRLSLSDFAWNRTFITDWLTQVAKPQRPSLQRPPPARQLLDYAKACSGLKEAGGANLKGFSPKLTATTKPGVRVRAG
eukprot:2645669-Rhodomonas_salina.2